MPKNIENQNYHTLPLQGSAESTGSTDALIIIPQDNYTPVRLQDLTSKDIKNILAINSGCDSWEDLAYNGNVIIDTEELPLNFINELPRLTWRLVLNNLTTLTSDTASQLPNSITDIELNSLENNDNNCIVKLPEWLKSLSVKKMNFDVFYQIINRFKKLEFLELNITEEELREIDLGIDHSLNKLKVRNKVYNINALGRVDMVPTDIKIALLNASEFNEWDRLLLKSHIQSYLQFNLEDFNTELAQALPRDLKDLDIQNVKSLDMETVKALPKNLEYIFLSNDIQLPADVIEHLQYKIKIIQ